jgi:hypothetical protein
MSNDETLELRLARAAYAEAEQMKKAAEQDRAAAEYERGQIEHAKRTMEQSERSMAARERWLEQHDEAKVCAIVADADKKLADAKALLASYDKEKHAAAISLNQINEREKRETEAAA